jgi:hypothetical protein
MKKTSTIVMAFALLMAMTQCKKNESTGDADNTGETVTIMLNVGNDDGSKVIVNPALGTVNFEEGDKIYVGSGGKYVGMLTHDGNHHFVGNITNPIDGQPLQFYFLGDVTPQETLSAGITEECSIVISDQTEHLPVISYAPSNENYSSSAYTYTAHLLNKCALVKFNVTTPSTTPIYITGMKNKVTVDFTQNTVTPSMDGDGDIVLCAGNEESFERWVILLPQAALEEGEEGTVHSKYGDYLRTRPAIPAITNNGYHVEGIELIVNTKNYPEGATNGLFTINSNGDQVYFSKGNLQYIESESPHYWKFADNQWSYFGESNHYMYQGGYNRDLFCWGTSGYNHGAVCYYPTGQSHNYEDFYAYGNWEYNLYDQTGQADWGYNAISNGGNQENSGWRTPTIQEWQYLFNNRNTVSGTRWTQGRVAGVAGTILLPDSWNSVVYELNDANGGNYNSNSISSGDWTDILEPNGAVFLPAAGEWFWTPSGYGYWEIIFDLFGTHGLYWSSSAYDNERAYRMFFASGGIDFMSEAPAGDYRYRGYSVRLIQDNNP